jgi:hypothetical protein
MMSVSIPRQPIKHQGLVTPAALTPTLADVMTALAQVQQNQAQILAAVQTTWKNQLETYIYLELMFEELDKDKIRRFHQIYEGSSRALVLSCSSV